MSAHLSPADTGRSRFTSWLPGKPLGMRDVLLIVDALDDFAHEHGEELLSSFAETQPALVELLESVRRAELPIVFANDNKGVWDGDVNGIVQRAFNGKEVNWFEASHPVAVFRLRPHSPRADSRSTRMSATSSCRYDHRRVLPKRRSTRGSLVSRSPSSRRRARR